MTKYSIVTVKFLLRGDTVWISFVLVRSLIPRVISFYLFLLHIAFLIPFINSVNSRKISWSDLTSELKIEDERSRRGMSPVNSFESLSRIVLIILTPSLPLGHQTETETVESWLRYSVPVKCN